MAWFYSALDRYERRRTCRIAKATKRERWQSADAARFLYKGQCYDAGSAIFRACDLCGKPIRLVYVLKVIESPAYSYSPEIDKLDVGECCFDKIQAVNKRLFFQLVAAAINLRTYMEAIERDRRVFIGQQEVNESEIVEMLQLRGPGLEEDSVRQLLEALLIEGGHHA